MSKAEAELIRQAAIMDVTPERLRRAGGLWEAGGDERTTRIYQYKDDALARVYERLRGDPENAGQRDRLAVEQKALERYYDAYIGGGLNGNLPSVDWSSAGSFTASGRDHTAKVNWQIDLREDFRRAEIALSKDQKEVVYVLVILGGSLKDAGYAIGRKSKTRAIVAAEVVLRGAAEVLADLWGMG